MPTLVTKKLHVKHHEERIWVINEVFREEKNTYEFFRVCYKLLDPIIHEKRPENHRSIIYNNTRPVRQETTTSSSEE
jgi:hypothetical protein